MSIFLILLCLIVESFCREPPSIMRPGIGTTIHLNEGSRFTVMCTLTKGSEPLFFKWLKDTNTITQNFNNIKIQTLPIMSTLVIDTVQKHDSGNYTCIVNNDVGEDTYTVPLLVKGTQDCDEMD
ncbi:Down syndrome cell adhesion molecule-like protein 1-like protein [Leptotrombidium deliense]|uniref:Down syndrome cell adhesion molecule-like protein 1-like protein n=1 Tax=Leptotrombidium deliense TaxID=299467 RepID=A0A443QR06_9ACAR|nr:Down syndrome cell adhesion molecule-like protein 1-like protein [Leptotrombidium deliense]